MADISLVMADMPNSMPNNTPNNASDLSIPMFQIDSEDYITDLAHIHQCAAEHFLKTSSYTPETLNQLTITTYHLHPQDIIAKGIVNQWCIPTQAKAANKQVIFEFNTNLNKCTICHAIQLIQQGRSIKNRPTLSPESYAIVLFLLQKQKPSHVIRAARVCPASYLALRRTPSLADVEIFARYCPQALAFVKPGILDSAWLAVLISQWPEILRYPELVLHLTKDLGSYIERISCYNDVNIVRYLPVGCFTMSIIYRAASAGLMRYIPPKYRYEFAWSMHWASGADYPGGMPADQWTAERMRHVRVPDSETNALRKYLRGATHIDENELLEMRQILTSQLLGFPLDVVKRHKLLIE